MSVCVCVWSGDSWQIGREGYSTGIGAQQRDEERP